MTFVAQIALYLAFGIGCYAVVALSFGLLGKLPRIIDSGKNAVLAMGAMVGVTSIGLWYALLSSDFSLQYVVAHTNRTLGGFYKFSAFWSGMEGSLLFWLLILSVYAFVFVFRNRKSPDPIYPTVALVVALLQVFFAGILCFIEDGMPFKPTAPDLFAAIRAGMADGKGLNTLLQDPAMVIHPPCLYVGYVGWAIPFGFGIGALLLGRRGSYWIEQARPWILTPWIFLLAGFSLGGWWAYKTLGWSGYWAWDPVENASFWPWVTGTAFLHSVMIQQRRDMLKIWNMVLLLLTFLLTIFGTYLTRGGLKELVSVHSFEAVGFAQAFFLFLAFLVISSIGLILWRYPLLKSGSRFDSLLSRELAFLLNNLVLVCICVAALVGTVWPQISSVIVNRKVTVAERWFNQVNVPLGLGLLLLMGIGPVIAWRKASASSLRRTFAIPLALGVLATVIFLLAGVPLENWKTLLLIFGSTFTLAITVNEFRKGARVRAQQKGVSFFPALFAMILENRRRYGGYLVHIGVVLTFIGFLGSHNEGYQVKKKRWLQKGEELSLSSGIMGTYSVQFQGIAMETVWNDAHTEKTAEVTQARLLLKNASAPISYLLPGKSEYLIMGRRSDMPGTEVAYHTTLMGDIYTVMHEWSGDGNSALIEFFLNPLISFVWWGVVIALLGGIFCLSDRRRFVPARAASRASPASRNRPAAAGVSV